MTVSTQLEILDLRHFSARQLRPLLERESVVWKERLRWDYESSIELLLKYLDSRILPGFVALDRGRVSGFTFCVYEGHKAVVGDAFSVGHTAEQSLRYTNWLLSHLLELLDNSPDIERVESQMLLYDVGEIEKSFIDTGFSLFPRLFMEYDLRLEDGLAREPDSELPEYLELASWRASHFQAAAELIHASYANHIDSYINDQYRSLHGSLRFLHNIVRFPGCGLFDADASFVLRDTRNGSLAGMVLCSRVAGDVGHIPQLCIAEPYRRQGLGPRLMRHCTRYLARNGFAAITLTVTESNLPAVKLYENLGFFVRQRFHAMVLDKRARAELRR
jgi:ribosomal protein S18 acetylase RimI-like enzyme